MKKTLLAIALTTSVGAVNAATDPMTSATFTMLDGTGGGVGLDTTVTGSIGDGAWAVASTTPFFGVVWDAYNGTTFGPGTYTIDTIQGGVYTGVVVGAGQVGGHILFNWGATADIDVINVWDIIEDSIADPTTILKTYTSTDVTAGAGTGTNTPITAPDGILGLSMIDGAFVGFNANFDFTFETADVTPPVITTPLPGDNPQIVVVGGPYVEAGAVCIDAAPQATQPTVITIDSSAVNTAVIADYPVTYDCVDTNLNDAIQVIRTVSVVAADAVTTLLEAAPGITTPIDYECENTTATYFDAGAQCDDPEDGLWTSFDGIPPAPPLPAGLDLTGVPSLPIDETVPGVTYLLTWACTDTDGNTGEAIRTVNVVDTITPVPGPFTQQDSVGTLVGDVLTLEVNDEAAYANLNPTLESVSDSCDTTVPSLVMTSDTVDFVIVSGDVKTSTLNYTTTDASGNVMNTPLTANVYRSEPVITIVGDNLILNVGEPYIEPGINIVDAQDGSIDNVTTSGVVTPTTAGTDPASPRDITVTIDSSAVNTAVEGVYDVTYDVTDFDGNPAAQVTRTVTVGVFASGSNFTMLDAQGNVFGGTNDVIFDWDQSLKNFAETDLNFNMSINSQQPFPFFGFVWTAHDVRVFETGTYSFDTGCTVAEVRATGCPAGSAANSGPTITMNVPIGMQGAHILFDWNTTDNIDVVNVWEIGGVWDRHGDTGNKNKLYDGLAGDAPDPLTTWKLVSTDINGDLVNGTPMVDGPFQGFYANFNAGPGGTAPPPEPYTGTAPDTKIGTGLASISVWGLSAGLLTFFGFRRFSKKQ